MRTRRVPFLIVLSCLCALAATAVNPPPVGNQLPAGCANRQVGFEANIGQADAAVAFLAHGDHGNLLLTPGEVWLALANRGQDGAPQVLRLALAGANPHPRLEGLDLLPGKVNYLLGNDPIQWRTDAPMFARVKYHDVYPGVDLIYYGDQQKLEYDLVLQPGANPNDLRLQFSGADQITLDASGDLILHLAGGAIRQHQPVVYQEIGSQRKMLAGKYVLHSGMQVGFDLAAYDRTQPLIIDPVLAFSTPFGGTGLNQGLGIAVDDANNVYVTGMTTAGDFPTVNPFQTNKLGSRSAYVVKFNTNGTVAYSTFLGGGLLNDQTTTATAGQGIAVDAYGHAFVAGYTTATNFPVLNAYQSHKAALSYSGRNAFVAELNAAGNGLIYSTYLGGTNSDTATGIALNTNGDAIITGYTTSSNFPAVLAAQPVYAGNGDAFVAKLTADGSALVYSTFLGGASYENSDLSTGVATPAGAVAVDFDGNAYVTGQTYSTNFPVLHALQPTNATSFYGAYGAAFVTKLDPAGNLVYSTYFGGRLGDIGRAIGVDFHGNVYFAGNSAYGDLPVTNALQAAFGGRGTAGLGDGFVAALDSTGTNLLYCTYLGGTGDDQINGIAVRLADGVVAVTGFTDSPNFPALNAVQAAGNQGLFISANGSATWNVSHAGLASGVIYSIQIDPANPLTVYALTANGCFKSTDGGANWVSMGSGLGSLSPSSYGSPGSLLALDPVHPGTLYAAGFSGVYKTTNGAASWTLASAGLPASPFAQTIAVDPNAPATLYVGTYFNGIYKSTNGAATWNVATNGLNTLNFDALVVDPNNSSNVYAGGGGFTFSASVFKSTNGGASWSLLGGGLRSGTVNLLAACTSPSTTLYSVIGNSLSTPSGSSPALQTSTNGGLNWSSLLAAGGLSFTALAIAPPAPPALAIASAGTVDNVSWPAAFAGYVLQSTPSLTPANWQNVLLTPVTNNGNLVLAVPVSGPQGFYRLLRTNQTAALPATLYLGTDSASGQGVLKSTDGGLHWNIAGPAGDTINALALNPANPGTVYAGLNGGRDGFITALTSGGQLYSSTYLGGSGADQGNAIAMAISSVFVTGTTASSDFPNTAAPKAVVKKGLVKAASVETSDGANNDFAEYFAGLAHGVPCPEDEDVVATGKIGQHFVFHPDSFWSFYDHTSGSLPPGFGTVGVLNSDTNRVYTVFGTGTQTGTYTYTIFYKTDYCNWRVTLTITITN